MSSLKKELKDIENQRQSVEHPHDESKYQTIDKLIELYKLSKRGPVKFKILKILEKKIPQKKN